jgi:antitoxin (DNA-binding transcriptional repressor) of toxin-antitoxin stability system
MTKDISVQEMQEHFADHMDDVRRGVTLRLIDGGAVVAEISSPEGEPAAISKKPESESTDDFVFTPAIRIDA